MTIELKCWPMFFGPISSGEKTFDLRLDDRDFNVGEDILLREWVPESYENTTLTTDTGESLSDVLGVETMERKLCGYTGRDWKGKITYILRSFPGLAKGYCVLGLAAKENIYIECPSCCGHSGPMKFLRSRGTGMKTEIEVECSCGKRAWYYLDPSKKPTLHDTNEKSTFERELKKKLMSDSTAWPSAWITLEMLIAQQSPVGPEYFWCRGCKHWLGGCMCGKGFFVSMEGANTSGCWGFEKREVQTQ